jgi:chemosensory pili system protein ChpA (sensor histidine kinase/response regulator)
MATSRENFALDWVKGALQESLDEAIAALDSFAEAGHGEAQMRECMTALHQVHGALVMLELKGTTLLAEHLERLAQHLMIGAVGDSVGAGQCLMQGLLELPGYLDEVQRGLSDAIEPMIPLINEIRGHLDERPLEGAMVTDLGVASEAAIERFDGIDGVEKAGRIRAAYQQVLLCILRGDDRERAVITLRKIAEVLSRVCLGTPHETQWRALGEFAASLATDTGPIDPDAAKLLRRIDSEIRTLSRDGLGVSGSPVSLDLIKQLLDACRQRGYRSEAIADMSNALAGRGDGGGLAMHGLKALVSASLVVREELALVKDQLDLFARARGRASVDLNSLVAPLKQIRSTLTLLGFESAHEIVTQQLEALEQLASAETVDPQELFSVASALVRVDESMASFTEGDQEVEKITNDAQRTVTVEVRNGLEPVRQAVLEYIAAGWDSEPLAGVPEQIAALCGALEMIPLRRAARILSSCGAYLRRGLLEADATPGMDAMETLADAITAVDYYLQRTAEDITGGIEDILDVADASLEKLGYAGIVDERPAAQRGEADQAETAAVEETSEEGFDWEGFVSEAADLREEPASTDALDQEAPESEPELIEFEPVAFEGGSDDEPEAEPEDASSVEETPVAASAPAPMLPPLSPAIAEKTSRLADAFESDEEIVEIFVEEVDEVLETINGCLPRWREHLSHEDSLTELRRAFHTLKGSGRMVGANIIGELAWSVENMLNRLIDGTFEPTGQFALVVEEATSLIPYLRDAFEAQRAPDLDGMGRIMEKADVLASGGSLEEQAPVGEEEPAVEAAEASEGLEALGLFVSESEEHLAVLAVCDDGEDFVLDEDAYRALHTLAGSAGMAGIQVVSELARPTYEVALAARSEQEVTRASGAVAEFLRAATTALARMIETLRAGSEPEEELQLIADADRLLVEMEETGEIKPDELMNLPALAVVMDAEEFLGGWARGVMDLEFAGKLIGALGEIAEVARATERVAVADLAAALRATHEQLEQETISGESHVALSRAHEALLQQFDAIAAQQTVALATAEIASLTSLREAITEPSSVEAFGTGAGSVAGSDFAEAAGSRGAEIVATGDAGTPVEPPAEAGPRAASLPIASLLPEEVDEDIIGIFFEEAEEILESLDNSIHEWTGEPDNRLFLENLLRGLHTLKGGARLSGLSVLGDYTHEFETFLIDFQLSSAPLPEGFFTDLGARYDELEILVSRIRKAIESGERGGSSAEAPASATPTFPAEPVAEPERLVAEEETTGAAAPEDEQLQPAEEAPVQASEVPDLAAAEASAEDADAEELPAQEIAAREAAAEAEPVAAPAPVLRVAPEPSEEAPSAPEPTRADRVKEMVRVGAGLLEELVNLAGESSIVRARIEQGMSDFTSALDEMETTIERVREQLRRLEIETEAQILFRRDTLEGPGYDEFDPLEMDRYSQLQQLSRGLSESASDMLDLKDTLLFKARESETLLLQQARINTELQEGLMRTRMVPFGRLLPRLRRIVRQVSRELGKDVELHAHNMEGELDRNLLERMVPPLEHMLRNAVDHGIESAEERRRAGKPNTGRIDIRLTREGGDVVIEIADDGAGINVDSVRAKAIERGLMAENSVLGDEEICQFVLAPGFSTAKSVTQISGRGVGMDVVHSEVKQLGGSINIVSRPRKGSRFVVRVPFTVSVNRALMVSVGDDLYAIPLNTIEGIVLLSAEELDKVHPPLSKPFEYAGVRYNVRYLGSYLGREYRGNPSQAAVPVVLVRSGDRAVAVHVDAVQGSREIVVKSLGPQFAGVGGVSGATILGDGSVVVILDLLALIRAQKGDGLTVTRRVMPGAAKTRCVMVVDDSVTVRKVTSRLLERQGMDVLVAKDGIEAIAMLQERRPDVMLLDIEMPRMDGFEVARQVRRDERVQDLPIVMISSRTGEKHQEHAAELGVNRFLGKPFQENELLATIDSLVN